MKTILSLLLTLVSSVAFAGQPVTEAGPRMFYKQSDDPATLTDTAIGYGKEVGGITELFIKDSYGNVTQVTSGGGLTPAAITPSFVGVTTLTYDGDALGSYTAASAQCATDTGDSSARVCTDFEVTLLVATGSTFGGSTAEVWVQDGAPGYTAFANDCDGWSSVASGYYGAYWNLSTKKAYLSGCASSKKYACCK